MVYKIEGEFDEIDFNASIDQIFDKFIFMYLDDTLFVALKDFRNADEAEEILRESYPIGLFLIRPITRKNINKLSEMPKEWCLNNLVRLDTDRYEEEQQEALKAKMELLDYIEKDLAEKAKPKLV